MIKNMFAAAAIGVAAFGAHANEVTNGSFESNGLNGSEYCYGCGATGWTGEILLSSTSGAWNSPQNNNPTGIDFGTTVDALQQGETLTSSFDFVQGDTYTLTWDDAGRTSYGTHGYDVLAGGYTFAEVTTDGQAWGEHSVTFTATSTSALVFQGIYNGGDNTSFIDNVSVTAVPEPASLLMMAVGTLGLLAWRRRAQV